MDFVGFFFGANRINAYLCREIATKPLIQKTKKQ
jgi:hypothetical protein